MCHGIFLHFPTTVDEQLFETHRGRTPVLTLKGAMGNWVVVSLFFYFHPHLGEIPILTNIFQMGWFNKVSAQKET